jgi:hypothetical protein
LRPRLASSGALALVLLWLSWAGGAGGAGLAAGAEPLRVAVIGDINGSYGTVGYSSHVHAAVHRIVELEPDLVIGVGDLIAGQRPMPRLDRVRIEEMWSAFDREVLAPLAAAGIPFVPVPGNHDASAEAGFALERTIYEEHWRRHRPDLDFASESGYPLRYGVWLQGVLVVVVDATTVGPLEAEQRGWLERTLADAAGARARIVAGHLPVHPFTEGRETEVLADVALEEALRRGKVDAYLSGHHHAFYPGFASDLLHLSQGCLGSGPRRLIGDRRRAPRSFTVVEISGDGELQVRALSEPDFTRAVDWSSLPPSIRHGDVELVRDDIASTTAGRPGGQPKAFGAPGSGGRDAKFSPGS